MMQALEMNTMSTGLQNRVCKRDAGLEAVFSLKGAMSSPEVS
jgi:hypothetical protein